MRNEIDHYDSVCCFHAVSPTKVFCRSLYNYVQLNLETFLVNGRNCRYDLRIWAVMDVKCNVNLLHKHYLTV